MTHSILRKSLAIAGALLAVTATLPADAAKKVTLPDIQVIGVDSVCDSFTASVDSNGNTVLTCVPAGTPPPAGAPTGCVATLNGATANVNLPSAGGQATLGATCVTTGVTYNWSRNGTFGASSAPSWTENFSRNSSTTLDSTTSYQVKACTTASACVTVPVNPLTVTVAHASGGGGGGGGWNGTCAGFNNTMVIDMDWARPVRAYSGPFGPNDIMVVRFTTGKSDSANNNLPRVAGAEWGSPPSGRYSVLSDTPCDMSAQKWLGGTSAGNSVQVPFAVGLGNNFGYYPILQKNTTYYFNVKNQANQSCSSSGVCDMFVELLKPSGL